MGQFDSSVFFIVDESTCDLHFLAHRPKHRIKVCEVISER